MSTVVSIAPYPFLPAKIGGQKGIAYFYKYFSQYEQLICLTVANNENSLAKEYDTIKVFSRYRIRYINPLNYFRIRNILKNKKATHLLIEHPYFGWLGIWLKKSCGLKLIARSHNIEANRFRTLNKWWWKILWHYERWTHRHADYNFFINEADLRYAVNEFGLDPEKCAVITYGIQRNQAPSSEERNTARAFLVQSNGIQPGEKILVFNGSFDYKPNVDALLKIVDTICPLLDKMDFAYKVIVCGPWLKEKNIQHPRVILKGFVESIETYLIGADVFVNPVLEGGGIKTKLVEALGNNCNSVSTVEGAIGIDPAICNGKLLLTNNHDWEAFAKNIISASSLDRITPPEFYEHFFWGNNARKAAEMIEK